MAAHRTRHRLILPIAGLLLGIVTAACSAIIGLDAPPSEGGGAPDATSDVASNEAGADSGAAPDAAVTCMPLGAGGSVYFPLTPTLDDAGTSNWSFFDVQPLPGFGTAGFAGGTFDGRYVYFAGNAGKVGRYDTTMPFGASGGFGGAVFDGRYVYFVPYLHGVAESVAVRFDTLGVFGAADSWATFDLATLSADGGAVTSGFFGAVFDGRYVFFIPRNDGAPDGRVLRYDSQVSADAAAPAPEGGAAGADGGGDGGADGGDGGGVAPGSFEDPSLWQSFDVTTINPEAKGFAGGVAGAGSLFLVPYYNDAFDAAVHSGTFGSSFTPASTWSTFDTTTVSSFANEYVGGAFDGQHVYFVPHATGIATRFDTTGTFTSTPSWSSYDMTRLALLDSGQPVGYAGAAYDGRFVYFIPSASGVAPVARYDTLSTFTADCAWSIFDPTSLAASGGSVLTPFTGAVFDGTYLYLIPNAGPNPIFARFTVRTPAPLPSNFPNFHGSFL
jgi:hypothetical protein